MLYSRLISVDDKISTYEGLKIQVERTTIQNRTADSSMSEVKKILESI
jgi:flagellar hook-associated protein 3 FlgL